MSGTPPSSASGPNKLSSYFAVGLAVTAVVGTLVYQRHHQMQLEKVKAEKAANDAKDAQRKKKMETSDSVTNLAGSRVPSFSRSATYYELNKDNSDHPSSSMPPASTQTWTALGLEQPLVIAMVGLPARGKSYLVKMIIRYLKWTGFECKVFNVGSYRRQVGLASADSNFFDTSNPNNHKIREQLAMAVQESMYTWLHETNEEKRRVAVFDATNTTKDRRLALAHRAASENVFLLFVESICDDQEVLMKNYELKLQNDDYKGMDPDTARRDFLSRVKQYERVYETITDDENHGTIAYIKLINVGQKVITRNCHGYLPSQVAFYLQNVHINPRKIYLSVICETADTTENRAGTEHGDLSLAGQEYANMLADYMIYEQEYDLVEKGKEILVLTGTADIHAQSVEGLKQRQFRCYHTPILNELRGGDLHGISKAAMQVLYPVEYAKRQADKLHYRYPGVGGESYLDVIERVRPVIIELERQRRSIVIVGHIAVLRCVYAYFMGVPLNDIPFQDFRFHHIYELAPGPFGCTCSVIQPHLPSQFPSDPNHNTSSNYVTSPNEASHDPTSAASASATSGTSAGSTSGTSDTTATITASLNHSTSTSSNLFALSASSSSTSSMLHDHSSTVTSTSQSDSTSSSNLLLPTPVHVRRTSSNTSNASASNVGASNSLSRTVSPHPNVTTLETLTASFDDLLTQSNTVANGYVTNRSVLTLNPQHQSQQQQGLTQQQQYQQQYQQLYPQSPSRRSYSTGHINFPSSIATSTSLDSVSTQAILHSTAIHTLSEPAAHSDK